MGEVTGIVRDMECCREGTGIRHASCLASRAGGVLQLGAPWWESVFTPLLFHGRLNPSVWR